MVPNQDNNLQCKVPIQILQRIIKYYNTRSIFQQPIFKVFKILNTDEFIS